MAEELQNTRILYQFKKWHTGLPKPPQVLYNKEVNQTHQRTIK